MKKIILLIEIAVLTFRNVMAQEKPSKRKTFDYIAKKLKLVVGNDKKVRADFETMEIEVIYKLGSETYGERMKLDQLRTVSIGGRSIVKNKDNVVFLYFKNSQKKISMGEWTSSQNHMDIVFYSKKEADRLLNALNRFIEIMNREDAPFDN